MTRARRERRFWLMKSEPESFSFDDLWKAPRRRTFWDGVRNYRARNLLRDELAEGDGVLFYHSNAKPPGVVGLAEVASVARVDPTQFDPRDDHFDPGADPESPRWYGVEVRALRRLPRFVSLEEIRSQKALSKMALVQRGQRLSVQPVTPSEWREIARLGGAPEA